MSLSEDILHLIQSRIDDLQEMIKLLRDDIQDVDTRLEKTSKLLIEHIQNEEQTEKNIKKIVDGMPHKDNTPDFEGHRHDHEIRKRIEINWERRKERVFDHVLTGFAWSVVIFIAFSLWEAVKREILK